MCISPSVDGQLVELNINHLLQIGQGFITNWDSFALLQNGADVITNWASLVITKWGGRYYKLGQLLEIRATVITNSNIVIIINCNPSHQNVKSAKNFRYIVSVGILMKLFFLSHKCINR